MRKEDVRIIKKKFIDGIFRIRGFVTRTYYHCPHCKRTKRGTCPYCNGNHYIIDYRYNAYWKYGRYMLSDDGGLKE